MEQMSLADSMEANSLMEMFPSKLKGSWVGDENASTMVGSVNELVLEKVALPDGRPVTVVQFLSRKWFSSTPLRNNMCCCGYSKSIPGPS